jgi:hypothetical protein
MTPRTDQPYRQETTAYAVMSAKGTPIFLADTLDKAQAFMADRERRNVRVSIVKETVVREAVA